MTVSDTVKVYGKVAPRSVSQTVDNKVSELAGLRYPIPKSPERGYFSKSVNAELVNSGLRDVIRTVPGERFMLPDYGCNVRNFLFEPLDEGTFLAIKDDVTTSIRKYLKKVSIGKLQVTRSGETGLKILLYCAYDDAQIPYFRVGVRV
jgi:phage baseplate assembly protein W|tara:strand:+ start:465 stop:908 length:444 start_codon:yes stop_codon:yes gene_type:complete